MRSHGFRLSGVGFVAELKQKFFGSMPPLLSSLKLMNDANTTFSVKSFGLPGGQWGWGPPLVLKRIPPLVGRRIFSSCLILVLGDSMNAKQPYLSVKQAAMRLGTDEERVRGLLRWGELKGRKLPGEGPRRRWLISPGSLEEYERKRGRGRGR